MNIKQIRQEIIHIIYQHYTQIPASERIHIKKELLEELLFITCDGYTYNTNQYVSFKVPIWTGKTLSKIDLSEISFDHVLWNYQILELISAHPSTPDKPFQPKYKIYDHSKKHENIYDVVEKNALYSSQDHITDATVPIIDFCNTNGPINFKNAFTIPELDYPSLYNCYFDGTNLSTANLEYCTKAHSCTFDRTQIQSNNINPNSEFINCSFENCNLSKLTISYDQFRVLFGYTCNLKNTGLHIEKVPPQKDNVLVPILFNYFEGCYLNNVKITKESDEKILTQLQTYQKQFELLNQQKQKSP